MRKLFGSVYFYGTLTFETLETIGNYEITI